MKIKIVLLLLCLSLLAACDTSVKARVLIVGDSIPTLAAPEIITEATMRDEGYSVTFATVPGISIQDQDWYWSSRLTNILDGQSFDVVVVIIGANDLRHNESLTINFNEELDNLLAPLGDLPIIFFGPDKTPTWSEAKYSGNLFQSVANLPGRYENLVLDNFFSQAPDNYYLDNSPHLSSVGRKELSKQIERRLDSV